MLLQSPSWLKERIVMSLMERVKMMIAMVMTLMQVITQVSLIVMNKVSKETSLHLRKIREQFRVMILSKKKRREMKSSRLARRS